MSRIQSANRKLKEGGIELGDKVVATVFLAGLSQRYNGLIRSIQKQDLCIREVKSKLLIEERRNAQAKTKGDPCAEDGATALAAHGRPNFGAQQPSGGGRPSDGRHGGYQTSYQDDRQRGHQSGYPHPGGGSSQR